MICPFLQVELAHGGRGQSSSGDGRGSGGGRGRGGGGGGRYGISQRSEYRGMILYVKLLVNNKL